MIAYPVHDIVENLKPEGFVMELVIASFPDLKLSFGSLAAELPAAFG